MNYKSAVYRGVGTVLLATTLGSCATIGSVQDLERRVSAVEIKPNAEAPFMIKRGMEKDGKSLDELYGWLRGVTMPQYNNSKSRADAEQKSDAITLVPTGLTGIYYAVVMKDGDNNSKPSKKDRTFQDEAGGKQTIQFVVDANKLPEDVKYMLLNVMRAEK